MAHTTAPDETPDDAGVAPGNSEPSSAAYTEQSVSSSRYLGRVRPSALPPSSRADSPAVRAPQLPPATVEAARSSSEHVAALPPIAPSGQPQAAETPALPGSIGMPNLPVTEYWPTGMSSRTQQQASSDVQESMPMFPQDRDALPRQDTLPWSGALSQQATDGKQAPSPSSGKVSLPRAVSLTQVPASGVLRDEVNDDWEEWEEWEQEPAPSLPFQAQAAETPRFTILPPEPVTEAPFSIPWVVEDTTSHSALEETIEVPKATGPLEPPPLVAREPGAATAFLPDIAEEAPLAAAVTKLQGACRELVDRIYKIRAMKSNNLQIIGALVELVNDLDARYATDSGTTRQNGMEELLIEVRRTVTEGDRFILESLENGRGGVTITPFERDLKTIAKADQPRIVMAYATFLLFMITQELYRYLQPLAKDEWRMREVKAHLDYLLDGVRQTLVAHLSNLQSSK